MDLEVAKNWCKLFSVEERVSKQRRTYIMAIEKIESVSHQIEMNVIANKHYLLVMVIYALVLVENMKTIIQEVLTILS
jgi:hypothetical protein